MTDEKNQFERDLQAWISIATRDLCEDAQQRLRAEIRAHVADALHDAMVSGQSESEAFKTIMAGLGDPEQAGEANRLVYLTQQDEETLNKLRRKLQHKTSVFLWIASILLTLVIFFPKTSADIARWSGLWLVAGTSSWVCRRLIEHDNIRAALLLDLIGFLVVVAILWTREIGHLAVILAFIFLFPLNTLRLFAKLRKNRPASPTDSGNSQD